MKHQKGFTLYSIFIVVYLAIAIVGVIGWGKNIVKLTDMPSITTGFGVVRIIGIPVAPLGAVMGYIDNPPVQTPAVTVTNH